MDTVTYSVTHPSLWFVEAEEVGEGREEDREGGEEGGAGRVASAVDGSWWGPQVGPKEVDLPDQPSLPSLKDLHRTYKHPPKAARADFSRTVATVWHRPGTAQPADQLPDLAGWILGLIFPRCILPAGRGPRQGDAISQSKVFKERLMRGNKAVVTADEAGEPGLVLMEDSHSAKDLDE